MKTNAARLAPFLAIVALFGAGCMVEAAPEDEEELDGEASADEEQTDTSEAGVACGYAWDVVCSNGQLEVFEHSNCSGGQLHFCPGKYPDLSKYTTNLGWFANWNDRISRLSTDKHVRVYAYQHVNYGGDVLYVPTSTSKDIGASLWNDKISSLKVVYVP